VTKKERKKRKEKKRGKKIFNIFEKHFNNNAVSARNIYILIAVYLNDFARIV